MGIASRSTTLLLLLACLVVAAKAGYTVMQIASCEGLVEAAAALRDTGNVEGQLLVKEIACDEPTQINIFANKLKLVGAAGEGTYTFRNVKFNVSSGIFRVDVDIEFTADSGAMITRNGGFLECSGRARFLRSVYMHDVAVTTVDERQHGGCIFNEGYLRFESEFTARRCNTFGDEGLAGGFGSAMYNEGKVIFKKTATFDQCGDTSSQDRPLIQYGGAIYNNFDTKISFFEDTFFTNNEADRGGAIYNEGTLKFLKRAKATFSGNKSLGIGGHVYTQGNFVMRNEGFFTNGYAGGNGGAIYQYKGRGNMTFIKDVEFTDNTSEGNGGAIYTVAEAVDELPEEATYSGNTATNGFCDDVYVEGKEASDFVCLP